MAAKERKAKKKGIKPTKSGRAGRAAGKPASPPSAGSAGPSNMMNRILPQGTRARMVVSQRTARTMPRSMGISLGTARLLKENRPRTKGGKPIKSRGKT
jgi:hypothetical protein